MASVRSVGWNLGSIREFGGAVADTALTPKRLASGGDIVTRRMGYAIGATVSYAAQGSILMYLFTGMWPWEDEDEDQHLKNFFFPKTGRKNPDGSDERLSLPHYSKDWVAWTTRPGKTAKHKLHPMWGTMADIWENKDYYGTKIRNEDDPVIQQLADVAKHIGDSFVPFSVRNYFRMRDAGEGKPLSAIMSLSGISSAPGYLTKTPAQKLMGQIFEERMPKGSRTKEQAEASDRRKSLVRDLRTGKKVNLERLTADQVRGIRRDAGRTSFQVSFGRLGFEDALNVFNVANTKERKQAFDILLDKKVRSKNIGEDALKMFYELNLTQAEIDKRKKADQSAIGKELLRLSVAPP